MFYEFKQNNSGGHFDVNENVSNRVFIEADNEEAATEKALSIGIYFNGVEDGIDCGCCGDRWYGCDEVKLPATIGGWSNKSGGTANTIEEYAEIMSATWGNWTDPDSIIHYKDGTKRAIPRKEVK